jgi:cytochrome P450
MYIKNHTNLFLGAKLTVPLLAEMKYVRGAMNETLRLLPVVQGIGRKTQKDLVLSGFQVD